MKREITRKQNKIYVGKYDNINEILKIYVCSVKRRETSNLNF